MKKTVKAWAVLENEGLDIQNDIFFLKRTALKEAKEIRLSVIQPMKLSVVPCTITFVLPKK